MKGAGKYDEVATLARQLAQAEGVLVAVINGNKGSGFSVQSIEPDIVEKLPTMLRAMADCIEADAQMDQLLKVKGHEPRDSSGG